MSSLFNELLIKARRDTSKLVKVQRVVTRGGTTFTQDYYVSPSQVKPTDKVIGNAHNLLPQTPAVPKPASGVFDRAYLDTLLSDKKKALEYIRSCGITWNEYKQDGTKVVEHISWMRAMMEVNKAYPVNKNGNQQASVHQAILMLFAKLDDSGRAEWDACKNGREKVVFVKKKLGQDGCVEFAKKLGVTWEEHPHNAINKMRMSMALQKHFDDYDGTVSTTDTKDNGKDKPKPTKPAPKPPADEIPVPNNATERQKNIVELINKVDSADDLKVYAGVGMVPEDDVAKSFIFEKLSPKYTMWKNAHGKNVSSSGKKVKRESGRKQNWGFSSVMSDNVGVTGCRKDIVDGAFRIWGDRFRVSQLTDPRSNISSVHVDGSTKGYIGMSDIYEQILESFSKYTTDEYVDTDDTGRVLSSKYMTNLGYTGDDPDVHRAKYDRSKDGFVIYLNKLASDYPELQPRVEQMVLLYEDALSKVGYNHQLLIQVLSSQSRGWTDYEYMSKYNLADFDQLYYKFQTTDIIWANTDNWPPSKCKVTLDEINYQIKALPEALRQAGLSDNEIAWSLRCNSWGIRSEDFGVCDEYGNIIRRIDLNQVIDPQTGKPYFGTQDARKVPEDGHHSSIESDVIKIVLKELNPQEYDKLPSYRRDSIYSYQSAMSKLAIKASISSDQYAEIHDAFHKMLGLKYESITKDSNGNIVWEPVDVLTYDMLSEGKKSRFVKDSSSSESDVIVSNLLMTVISTSALRNMSVNANDNVSSPVNDYGDDYSGNVSFYYPTTDMRRSKHRISNRGNPTWGGATYTVADLNTQIDEQLSTIPTVSREYLDSIKSYYAAKGNYDQDTIRSITQSEHIYDVGSDPNEFQLSDYIDSPLKDIMFMSAKNICQNIPRMNTDNLDRLLSRRFNYMPYDFTASSQPTFLKPKKDGTPAGKSDLRLAREEAFKAVNCTIATEDADTSLRMRKEFLANWDYDGVTKPKLYSGAYHGEDRRALFNSRFFKINNSNFEQPFKDYAKELGQTPEEHYHGTSYGSTAGILGVSGGWYMGNQYTKAGKALGNGAYFGRKGGKSSVYVGDNAYANVHWNNVDDNDSANGCMVLAQLIHGKQGESSISNSFREYEICVKNNKCILPHHFVDLSCRNLGRNVTRDSKGNYLNSRGEITHDRYGQAIDMK